MHQSPSWHILGHAFTAKTRSRKWHAKKDRLETLLAILGVLAVKAESPTAKEPDGRHWD